MTQLKQPNLTVKGKAGWCLSVAQDVWGVPHWYPKAIDAWNASTAFNHPNEQPPSDVSVVVYWTYVENGIQYGHIATFVPGRGVYTSPFNSLHGAEWYASIQAMTDRIRKIDKNSVYLGWSEVLSNVKLVTAGGSMADTISADTDRILQHGILGRNGLRGRAYALDGSTGKVFEGQQASNANIQAWFLSEEGRQWRDSNDANSVNGINARLDSIPAKDAKIAELSATTQSQQATIADLQLQLTGKQAEIADLQDDIATLKTENEALKKQVKDLEAQVAAGGTDVTINFNNFGVIAWTLIKSFGLKKG